MQHRQDLTGQCIWVLAKGYRPDEGGMQTYAEGVAEAYAQLGARVTVFTQTSVGPRRKRIGSVELIDIGPGKSISVPLRFLRAMRREAQQSGPPRLVHGTTWRTALMAMLLHLPYVVTFHGREFMYAQGAALFALWQVAKRSRRCIAVSEFTADRLKQRLSDAAHPTVVAWNGLSPWMAETGSLANSSRPHEKPLIFSLCRLEPRKNILACVRACKALQAQGLEFRYVIAGRGPELLAIRKFIAENDLAGLVDARGFISTEEAAQLYADADIFLHPQTAHDGGKDFEGFGIAIADAMGAGCAAIVGAEGGSPELVEDGKSGIVVDGNSREAIENALRFLLQNGDRCSEIGTNAKARSAKFFSWERHVSLVLHGVLTE